MTRQRIAVLGGGMGALSALFAITDRDGWDQQYDITVYQLGWRLGGKGATGRDQVAREPDSGARLPHALRLLRQHFATMRKCYEELGRDPSQPISALVALSSVDEARSPGRYAFHRQNTAVLQQRLADGYVAQPRRSTFPRTRTCQAMPASCRTRSPISRWPSSSSREWSKT